MFVLQNTKRFFTMPFVEKLRRPEGKELFIRIVNAANTDKPIDLEEDGKLKFAIPELDEARRAFILQEINTKGFLGFYTNEYKAASWEVSQQSVPATQWISWWQKNEAKTETITNIFMRGQVLFDNKNCASVEIRAFDPEFLLIVDIEQARVLESKESALPKFRST
jgi:hypothetical protein